MHACVHALTAKWQAHLRVLNITFILVLTKSKVWDNEKCVCVCVRVCTLACLEQSCDSGGPAVMLLRGRSPQATLHCLGFPASGSTECAGLAFWPTSFSQTRPCKGFSMTLTLFQPAYPPAVTFHVLSQMWSKVHGCWHVNGSNLESGRERETGRMFCTIFSVTRPIRQQVDTEVLLTPKAVMWFLYKLFCFRMLHWALQGGREDGTGEGGGSTGGPFTPVHRGTSPADSCSLRPRLSEPREGSVEAPSAGGILLDVT